MRCSHFLANNLSMEALPYAPQSKIKGKKLTDITSGVKVIRIDAGSLVSRTNMDVGFVITHLNNTPINSSEELQRALQTAGSKVVFEGSYEDC